MADRDQYEIDLEAAPVIVSIMTGFSRIEIYRSAGTCRMIRYFGDFFSRFPK
jgi:hypothetical protein